MELDDADISVDGGGGGGKAEAVWCSICLEEVTDNGDRSSAKLLCGHRFHLDCIGSAFNAKGAMQCPNCRKIEKGQWLYAGGNRSLPEFSMDEWMQDDDTFEQIYSEMSSGVHWCPFSGFSRFPSSFEEGEFSSNAYLDFLRQHAIFDAHTSVSPAAHPCPYVAYIGPIQASSSNRNGNISEGSNTNHWNNPTVPNERPTSYVFPGMDVHYNNWEHHSSSFSPSNRASGADQVTIASASHSAATTNSAIPRSGSVIHPLIVAHSSAARTGSSAASMISPYPSNVSHAHGRVQPLQAAYSPQPSASPAMHIPGTRRSSSHRGLVQAIPVASSSSDQTGGVYLFPLGSSGRTFQEADSSLPNRLPTWDREHLPYFPLNHADQDPGWVSFSRPAGGLDSGARSGSFRQRHGSQRMPSHNRS